MTRDEVAAVMQRVWRECEALRAAGQAEYAGGANAFGNFERYAEALGASRELVLWIHATKHVDGITSWIRGHRSQREPVQGRINDLIVYLVLLRAMVEDEAPRAGEQAPRAGEQAQWQADGGADGGAGGWSAAGVVSGKVIRPPWILSPAERVAEERRALGLEPHP